MKWVFIGVGALVLLLVAAGGIFAVYEFVLKPKPAPPVVSNPPPTDTPQVPPPVEPAKPPVAPEGMVAIPGGVFQLGSAEADADAFSQPAHEVTIKPFFLDKTEVTNAEYKKFVDETKHKAPDGWVDGAPVAGSDTMPVVNVTWQDAADYAKWAKKRLPTESEWEFAARGTDGRIYAWGSTWDTSRANVGDDAGQTKPVGSYPTGASPFGVLDMIGNVWEWTSSDVTLYPGSTVQGIEKYKGMKVFRGGAFDAKAKTTAMYRGFDLPTKPFPKIGFRCAKDAQ